MRNLQQWIFWAGVAAFIISVAFMGGWIGDTLWRAGVAAMLVVLGMRAVWPAACVEATAKGTGA
jgi:hypothetical protein